jgi:hypothetical protein
MIAELVIACGAAALAIVDVQAYYLVTMLVLGVFSSTVIYLLQKLKEERYSRRRAAFDRRVEMADGLGFVAGSALAVAGVSVFRSPAAVAALGALQTAVVYGLFLLMRRSLPPRRRARLAERNDVSGEDEEPHPWSLPAFVGQRALLTVQA